MTALSCVDRYPNIEHQIESVKHKKENLQRDMRVLKPKVRDNPENLAKYLELNDELRVVSITLAELVFILNML
jgi:uncharacterized protein YeeX (DUF496 family)